MAWVDSMAPGSCARAPARSTRPPSPTLCLWARSRTGEHGNLHASAPQIEVMLGHIDVFVEGEAAGHDTGCVGDARAPSVSAEGAGTPGREPISRGAKQGCSPAARRHQIVGRTGHLRRRSARATRPGLEGQRGAPSPTRRVRSVPRARAPVEVVHRAAVPTAVVRLVKGLARSGPVRVSRARANGGRPFSAATGGACLRPLRCGSGRGFARGREAARVCCATYKLSATRESEPERHAWLT